MKFSTLDSAKLPSGILYDNNIIDVAEILKYNGKTCNKFTCNEHWQSAYDEIRICEIFSTITDSVSVKNKIIESTQKGYIPFGIIDISFAKIKENALRDNLLVKKGNSLYDNTTGNASAYTSHRLTVASPLLSSVNTREKIFFIDPQLFLRNHKNKLQRIEIDFGDGHGYRIVNVGDYINVSYDIEDTVTISTRITNESESPVYSFSRFYSTNLYLAISHKKADNSAASTASTNAVITEHETPDTIWDLSDHCRAYIQTPYIDYNSKIRRKKIMKPFIFVEGLNYWAGEAKRLVCEDCANNQYRYGGLGWDVIRSGDDPEPNALSKAPVSKAPVFLEALQKDGFDIIYLDFYHGAGNIKDNAEVLIELINKINAELVKNNSNHKITVLAASMGGIISRYALSKIEKYYNYEHNVRLLITHDSPHKGANIPLGMQYMALDLKSLSPGLYDSLTLDAPKQLLSLFMDDKCDPLRSDLINDPYYALPEKPFLIGLSNGSLSGTTQPYKAGDIMFINGIEADFTFLLKILAQGDNSNVFEKYIGVTVNDKPIYNSYKIYRSEYSFALDPAPGGMRHTYSQVLEQLVIPFFKTKKGVVVNISLVHGGITHTSHCFIPLYSSLNLNTEDPYYKVSDFMTKNVMYVPDSKKSFCPFDIVCAPNENQKHCELTDENINWYMNFISPTDAKLQNLELDGIYETRNTIAAGSAVNPENPNIGQAKVLKGKKAELYAANTINLKPGFVSERGALLTAKIKNMPDIPQSDPELKSIPFKNAFACPDFDTTSSLDIDIPKNSGKEINVYPNPTTGIFNIRMNGNSGYSYMQVFDMYGKPVIGKTEVNAELRTFDLSGFPAGVYIIKVFSDKKIITEKIILE